LTTAAEQSRTDLCPALQFVPTALMHARQSYKMSEQFPEERVRQREAVRRFAIHGAWIGALFGTGLSLLLRSLLGRPEHYAVKTAVIIGIVAGFGAFVGVLSEALLRARGSDRLR
jgi:hypothetical protein